MLKWKELKTYRGERKNGIIKLHKKTNKNKDILIFLRHYDKIR